MKKVNMNHFYVYNIGEIHNIETVEDIKSIMGNQEDGE